MLTNKTKKENEKITSVSLGSFYTNNEYGDCDILIIKDGNGETKMLNAHCFTVVDGVGNSIHDFLNRNGYYEINAEIVRTN